MTRILVHRRPSQRRMYGVGQYLFCRTCSRPCLFGHRTRTSRDDVVGCSLGDTCVIRARRDGARDDPHSSTGALPLAMDSSPRSYYTSSPGPPRCCAPAAEMPLTDQSACFASLPVKKAVVQKKNML